MKYIKCKITNPKTNKLAPVTTKTQSET